MTVRAAIFAAVSSKKQADDKESIPTQLEEARVVAKAEGWQVVAEYVIPGFSRDYFTIDECIVDMMKENPPITALRDCKSDWEAQHWDVLIVRAADRLGRKPSMILEMVGRICTEGKAKIRLTGGGVVDSGNWYMLGSMYALETGSFQAQKIHSTTIGMNGRVARGLSMTHPPFTHRLIRNEAGIGIALVVDEEKRVMLDRLADLLLSGAPWREIAWQMGRYGYINPDTGHGWSKNHLRRIFFLPYTWGHSGRLYRWANGMWAFDPTVPVPEGVIIQRDTVPPVWTGERAEQIKQNLRDRVAAGTTRATPNVSWFSGLLVCKGCQCRLAGSFSGRTSTNHLIQYRCPSSDRASHVACEVKSSISGTAVRKWLSQFLRAALAADRQPDFLFVDESPFVDREVRVSQAQREVDLFTRKLDRLMTDAQEIESPSARAAFRRQAESAGKLLDGAKERLGELMAEFAAAEQQIDRDRRVVAWRELQEMGVDALWKMPEAEQNRLLKALFGHYRMVVDFRTIVGIAIIKRTRGKMPWQP